ncbi:hypothetical protein V1477_017399 [Vespula maculifrons]|uniref:Uncharacterized protein n=1 Tax=Vespula maculifrons TaxID=7453 RepID=A0ABD2B5Y8_VESMC
MAVTTQTNEQVRPFPWQQSQSDRRTSRTENRETRRIMYSIQVIYSAPDTIFMSWLTRNKDVTYNKHRDIKFIQFPSGSGSVKSDRADQKFEEIDGAKSGFLSRI